MPQSVDNRFKSGINAPLSRSLPSSRGDTANGSAGDLFQKVLNSSRQKARESEAQPEPKRTENNSKTSTRAKRAESAGRRRRPDVAEDASTDQTEQSDVSAYETPDEEVTAVADADAPVDAQPAESHEESKDAAPSGDPLSQAIAAAQQNVAATQPPSSTIQPVADSENSDQPGEEAAANPLAALKLADPKASLANQLVPGENTKDSPEGATEGSEDAAVQAGFQIPGAIAGADSAKDTQVDVSKLKKVSALGQTIPPTAEQDPEVQSDGTQAKPAEAMQALSAADVLTQLADPDHLADADDENTSAVKPLSDALNNVAGSTQSIEPAPTKTLTSNDVRTAQPSVPPEVNFAETNHDRIVTSLKSQLLPNGGTMHMRLDPPELGVLQITVKMRDGVMTASFETSGSDATKLLSHSLGQLKAALESQGVSVEKLHVQESPSNQQSSADDQQQSQQGDQSANQEQQRREMLKRMWRRLGIGSDPLDMVA